MKLTYRDVLYIFSQRAQVNRYNTNPVSSRQLAARYGISERTVRDIWTRRSRTTITRAVWTAEEVKYDKKKQRIGRPPGSKDSAPRKRNGASSSEQETSSSDGGSGTARETSSSDGGTARQSDTTGSRNQTSDRSSGDSGENSNGSQQEGSSSASGRENSSSGSGDSSPQQQESTAPSASEQNVRNKQLNKAVLSLLGSDWCNSATAQQALNNSPAPAGKQQLISTPQTFAPTSMQVPVQSAPHLAQFGASSGFQQPLAGHWPSQNLPPSHCSDGTYSASLQPALGYAQAQHSPDLARQSSASGLAPQWQMPQLHGHAAAPPPQSYAQSSPQSFAQSFVHNAPPNPALNSALTRACPPFFAQDHAPSSSQQAFKFVDPVPPETVASAVSFKFEVPGPTPSPGAYGQPPPQPSDQPGPPPPGIFGASYTSPHQPHPPAPPHPNPTLPSYQLEPKQHPPVLAQYLQHPPPPQPPMLQQHQQQQQYQQPMQQQQYQQPMQQQQQQPMMQPTQYQPASHSFMSGHY